MNYFKHEPGPGWVPRFVCDVCQRPIDREDRADGDRDGYVFWDPDDTREMAARFAHHDCWLQYEQETGKRFYWSPLRYVVANLVYNTFGVDLGDRGEKLERPRRRAREDLSKTT